MKESMSLKYETSLEPHHNSAKQWSLNREIVPVMRVLKTVTSVSTTFPCVSNGESGVIQELREAPQGGPSLFHVRSTADSYSPITQPRDAFCTSRRRFQAISRTQLGEVAGGE